MLLLIVVAYAESLLRSLRRGRRRRQPHAAVAGLVVVGALGGMTATLWGWMFGITGPTLVLLHRAMRGLGAVAGLLAGLAGRQVGERTRARRQANRLVLVARRYNRCPRPSPHRSGPVAETRHEQDTGGRAWRTGLGRGRSGQLGRRGGPGDVASLRAGGRFPSPERRRAACPSAAVVNGQPAATSSDAHPAQLYPDPRLPTCRSGSSTTAARP